MKKLNVAIMSFGQGVECFEIGVKYQIFLLMFFSMLYEYAAKHILGLLQILEKVV